jgi:hypothetical protein
VQELQQLREINEAAQDTREEARRCRRGVEFVANVLAITVGIFIGTVGFLFARMIFG